jgi:hypothetical protein
MIHSRFTVPNWCNLCTWKLKHYKYIRLLIVISFLEDKHFYQIFLVNWSNSLTWVLKNMYTFCTHQYWRSYLGDHVRRFSSTYIVRWTTYSDAYRLRLRLFFLSSSYRNRYFSHYVNTPILYWNDKTSNNNINIIYAFAISNLTSSVFRWTPNLNWTNITKIISRTQAIFRSL